MRRAVPFAWAPQREETQWSLALVTPSPPRECPEGPVLQLHSGEATAGLLPSAQSPWGNWQRGSVPSCLVGVFYSTWGGALVSGGSMSGFESQLRDPGKATALLPATGGNDAYLMARCADKGTGAKVHEKG